MLDSIFDQSSQKTVLISDESDSVVKSLSLALALAKSVFSSSSNVVIVETELCSLISEGLSWDSFIDGKKVSVISSCKSFDDKNEDDELQFIYRRVREECQSGGLCLFYSVTPLLFKYSHTRVARFLGALSCLTNLKTLLVALHSDCHIFDEVTQVNLQNFQESVSDVICTLLPHNQGSGPNLTIKVTSGKGKKSRISRHLIAINEQFKIEEKQFAKNIKPKIANSETAGSSDPDSLIQTTFRLGLRDSEVAAKNQVVLPYWKKDSSVPGSTIEYVPDEADDWDEEDPDDDLNF